MCAVKGLLVNLSLDWAQLAHCSAGLSAQDPATVWCACVSTVSPAMFRQQAGNDQFQPMRVGRPRKYGSDEHKILQRWDGDCAAGGPRQRALAPQAGAQWVMSCERTTATRACGSKGSEIRRSPVGVQ